MVGATSLHAVTGGRTSGGATFSSGGRRSGCEGRRSPGGSPHPAPPDGKAAIGVRGNGKWRPRCSDRRDFPVGRLHDQVAGGALRGALLEGESCGDEGGRRRSGRRRCSLARSDPTSIRLHSRFPSPLPSRTACLRGSVLREHYLSRWGSSLASVDTPDVMAMPAWLAARSPRDEPSLVSRACRAGSPRGGRRSSGSAASRCTRSPRAPGCSASARERPAPACVRWPPPSAAGGSSVPGR